MGTAKKSSGIDSPRLWPKLMILLAVILFAGSSWLSSSLKGLPGNGSPQQPFDFSRMVGNWFEIARLENELEEDFGQATLKVVQSSKNKLELTLSDPKTKTAFPFDFEYDADNKVGSAFLSCWGPLVCGYHVIAMDKKDLSWMMIAGHTLDELWLFSRAPGLPPEVLKKLLAEAQALGYDTENLVINNKPPEIAVKPENKGDKASLSTSMPSYPGAPVPETPANEPPQPLHLPEVPTTMPAIPKDIPAIPKDVPPFGKPPPTIGEIIGETPAVSSPKANPKKPQKGKDR
jgi:apolipoprotein D and lipocalin family protein